MASRQRPMRRRYRLVMARIPTWAADGATSCIFPRQIQNSWPKTEFKPIEKSEASCLRITDVRGKGKGCVVARAVTPQQTAHALANSMSPKQRATFSAFYNCKSADPNDLFSILRTNSFLIPGMPGPQCPLLGSFRDVFSHQSRVRRFSSFCHAIMNEPYVSCCPNAIFRWDKDTFSGEIRELRTISEGEEVTIAYFQEILEPGMVTRARQK
jgi:hypothetical protein